jgi:hypothetical protein
MVYTYFESQKFIHPMSLVPNRTPRALGKAFAVKKMPAGTRMGTAGLVVKADGSYQDVMGSNPGTV